jgi:dihydroorotate dehydrogenase
MPCCGFGPSNVKLTLKPLWLDMWYPLLRSLLFTLDEEKSHYVALQLLKSSSWDQRRRQYLAAFPSRPVNVLGMTFPNPVGLAAGLDKNGDYIAPLQALGFGFVEIGTVTPKPQNGNPKPRLFRLPAAQAIINRMGFNNFGVEHLVKKLREPRLPGIVGANIGKNTQTPLEEAAADYCFCLEKVYSHVDYVTVNISSPNSPGLRNLQSANFLNHLLTELDKTQQQLAQEGRRKIPLLVKIDPDLHDSLLPELVAIILDHQVDGIIATNTTVNHRLVEHLPHGHEPGGLSGEPLFQRSTQVVRKLVELLGNKLPVVAVGGILSPEDALEKLAAGASLVQLYTGLIYRGPSLIRDIVKKL